MTSGNGQGSMSNGWVSSVRWKWDGAKWEAEKVSGKWKMEDHDKWTVEDKRGRG